MLNKERFSVSQSTIIKHAASPLEILPPPEIAQQGRKKHTQIIQKLSSAFAQKEAMLSSPLESTLACYPGPFNPEVTIRAPISPRVDLVARVDITKGTSLCGEIKPGPKLKGRYYLQLLLQMWASSIVNQNTPDGLLYLYKNNQTVLVPWNIVEKKHRRFLKF